LGEKREELGQGGSMSQEKGRGREFWVGLAGVVIAALTLVGVGKFIYDEVWHQKKLTYTVLPTYDLQNQFFTGLVVENRGRVTLTDVRIVFSDLDAPMRSDPYMPGAHEPANLVSGGKNQTEALIELPRLSKGASLPAYILTPEEVSLEESETFFVSSRETPGVAGSETSSLGVFIIIGLVNVVLTFLVMLFLGSRMINQLVAEMESRRSSRTAS
jgi:hypothetical protein